MRCGCLIPLFVLALLATAPPASAEPAGATRIAIANPARIFNDMQETKALRAQLEDKRKQLEAQEHQFRDNINFLLGKRANVNPHHPSFREMTAQIDKAKADLQAWGLATKASVERDQKEMLQNLYEKIEAAVGEIAQKNGIDLVIADARTDLSNLEEAPAEEVRRVLNARNVLYSSKTADITEQVITLLDAKFAQGGAGVPAPLK